MKKLISTICTTCALALMFSVTACSQSGDSTKKASVKGEITGLDKPMELRFSYYDGQTNQSKIVNLAEDGKFSFSVDLTEPVDVTMTEVVDSAPERTLEGRVEFIMAPGTDSKGRCKQSFFDQSHRRSPQ